MPHETTPVMGEVPATTRFGYNPALDGLRALAVVEVISLHAGLPQFAGLHGVTVFFVISGYLITSLLLAEHVSTGTIHLRHFYLRRFARLGPAMILVVFVTVVWLLAAREPLESYWAGLVGTLTYTMDFIQAIFGNGSVSSYFQWSWSLAVEEQFYLVWPALLLLMFLRRPTFRLLIGVLSCIVVLGWVARYVLQVNGASHELLYFGPLTHVDSIVLGVILALVLTRFSASAVPARIGRWIGPLGAMGLVFLYVRPFGLPIVNLVDGTGLGQTGLASAAVVLWLATTPRGWFARVLSVGPLVFLGKLSYGLYLWNLLTVLVFERLVGVPPVYSWWGLLWAGMLVLLCWLSWRFVETPLRRRWAPPGVHSVVASA